MTSDSLSPDTSPVTSTEQAVALDYVSQSAPGSPRNNTLPTQFLPGIGERFKYLPAYYVARFSVSFLFQFLIANFRKINIGELFVQWVRNQRGDFDGSRVPQNSRNRANLRNVR